MAREIVQEFDSLWNSKYALDFDTFYESYREKYKIIKHQRDVAKLDDITSIEKYKLEPNSMQVGFIKNLRKIQEAGERKALLISATGTGKTYASAFAMRELGFQRVLFLVHRNQIAKQAKKSFRKVFSGQVSMGLVTGKYQEYDKDFIFATIQTLSKEENLQRYEKTAFDAIVIDEAHHSAANSYKKVLDYFEPKLWLGMTATPDKRDDNLEGRNIYEIFNHQIAYEIRLQDAMEEDLLCPFHYFGITDLDIIADAGKSSEEKVENFRYLTSEERVENVMKQAEYFGYSGDRVKGLIFCSRIDEANELSKKFNAKGWRTLVLSASDSEEARAEAIERLAGEESEDALDYIISVDIFSEGVDVPEINQVIMLRPTESPIVFIQQLGRGLRKAENKEYVVVLDFVGNYRNNFMIPIALSGDRSYNKDNIRRYVTEGGRVIPGASTIHFDEISRKRIFQAIDNANFSDIKLIRENYTNLELYQKYTYEDACRLLNWERNEVPLNIGGCKYDKKTKTFPIFINYDKQDNISDTTKYEDHFVAENRLIAISKSGRSMDSEDVRNFLKATERGIDVQLFVRKNKDDKISKEFYYLGRVIATGNAKQFVMPNTDKTAVKIEWELETPVREDIYQYIVNE